jgi:hypothetical protein
MYLMLEKENRYSIPFGLMQSTLPSSLWPLDDINRILTNEKQRCVVVWRYAINRYATSLLVCYTIQTCAVVKSSCLNFYATNRSTAILGRRKPVWMQIWRQCRNYFENGGDVNVELKGNGHMLHKYYRRHFIFYKVNIIFTIHERNIHKNRKLP